MPAARRHLHTPISGCSPAAMLYRASCSCKRNGFGPRVVLVDPPAVDQLVAGAVVTGAVAPGAKPHAQSGPGATARTRSARGTSSELPLAPNRGQENGFLQ